MLPYALSDDKCGKLMSSDIDWSLLLHGYTTLYTDEFSMAAVSAAAAGTSAVGALYMDGMLQLSKDISSIHRVSQGEQNFKRADEFMFGFEMCQMLRKPQLQRAEHRTLTCSSSPRGYTANRKPFVSRGQVRLGTSLSQRLPICALSSV
jgi:hypothetical protein